MNANDTIQAPPQASLSTVKNMDARTLEALKGSIAKWERIVAGAADNKGPSDCPLCRLFNPIGINENDCTGCPVMERTGEKYCLGTPYVDYENAEEQNDDGEDDWRDRMKDLAQAELDFLRSLLPDLTP